MNAACQEEADRDDPDAQGHFVPAFALALGADLGFAPVLQPSQGTPRCVLMSRMLTESLLQLTACSAGFRLIGLHTLCSILKGDGCPSRQWCSCHH